VRSFPALFLSAALLAASGYAGEDPAAPSVDDILRRQPIAAGEAAKSVEVSRTAEASFHVVQVAVAEKPHRHDAHDLTLLVLRGRGTLYIDGKPRAVSPGDTGFIPRGVPHYFVNGDPGGVAVAWVTFTPAFDKKDIIPVPAPDAGH
jgi:quercetin dioxygenase-like cupin family protein